MAMAELMDDVEQDWGLDPEDRWVRLMADVSAPGVWHRDGSCDVAEALPISRELMSDIYEWQYWYDAEERRHEAGTVFEMADDWDADGFAARGLELARRLKAELPDWTIVYHDIAAVKRSGGYRAEGGRDQWEYEVRLDPGSSPG
jgi:hypothetical protein